MSNKESKNAAQEVKSTGIYNEVYCKPSQQANHFQAQIQRKSSFSKNIISPPKQHVLMSPQKKTKSLARELIKVKQQKFASYNNEFYESSSIMNIDQKEEVYEDHYSQQNQLQEVLFEKKEQKVAQKLSFINKPKYNIYGQQPFCNYNTFEVQQQYEESSSKQKNENRLPIKFNRKPIMVSISKGVQNNFQNDQLQFPEQFNEQVNEQVQFLSSLNMINFKEEKPEEKQEEIPHLESQQRVNKELKQGQLQNMREQEEKQEERMPIMLWKNISSKEFQKN